MSIYEKDEIYELIIDEDDEMSGIDSISLVDEPAIEVDFVYFNKTKKDDCVIPDGHDEEYLKMFEGKGENEEDLLKDGWVVESATPINYETFTSPNAESVDDTEHTRVRYRYGLHPNLQGQPFIISTSRQYCKSLVSANAVYRREDILTESPNRGSGGNGSPLYRWRGGFNCRHYWWRITYKKEGKIYNNATVNINKIKDAAGREITRKPSWSQPSTATSNSNVNYLKENMEFKVFDEEKKVVIGPAMIPDYKMPRKNNKGDIYQVYFSADTIRMIAEKYMKNKYTDNNDIMHSGFVPDDVYVTESWIKEDNEDKSTKYGFGDLPIGSWFVSMKVKNDEVWEMVKEGKLKGYSVSGFFGTPTEMTKEDEFLWSLAEIMKKY